MGTQFLKLRRLTLTLVLLLVLFSANVNASHFEITDQASTHSPLTITHTKRQLASELEPDTFVPNAFTSEKIQDVDAPPSIAACEPITFVDFDWVPLNPKVGEEITFSVTSLQPVTASLPITYTWDFADGYGDVGEIVSHAYSTSGTYWVYITAKNPCSEVYMSHPVDVASNPANEPDIDVSPVYGFSILCYADDTITNTLIISNQSSATAYLNWELIEDPSASWLDASPTTGSLAPGGEDQIIVTVDSTGLSVNSYLSTTLLIISNDPDESPWISTTVDIYVLTRSVETVTLSLITSGLVYTDTLITYSADIEPDQATKPYTFTIDFGSGPTVPSTSSSDPYIFDNTFSITGTHTITFSAWNTAYPIMVSDSVSVTVLDYNKRFIYLPVVLHNP